MAKHPLFATKDVWANVLSGMATRTSDKGIFETLLSRQINQDMMPETLKIARRFVNSRNNKRPMNNFLWRGITSYGKSTGVEMVAALLHTPLRGVFSVRVGSVNNKQAGGVIYPPA